MVEAASTAEKVRNREEFRQLLTDVGKLPETQRSALLLREMDAMSYEEIAAAMETSVPSVKSLLVRARISLAEASQARQLTCGEVRLELAEAAEGLRKVSGPVRRHVRDCDECSDFRSQVRSNDKVMAALFPVGALVALKSFIASKLGLGGASGGASRSGRWRGAGCRSGRDRRRDRRGRRRVGSVGAALSGSGAASGIGAVGGAIGTKAVAGVVTAAVLTAGAVEVNQKVDTTAAPKSNAAARSRPSTAARLSLARHRIAAAQPKPQPVEPDRRSGAGTHRRPRRHDAERGRNRRRPRKPPISRTRPKSPTNDRARRKPPCPNVDRERNRRSAPPARPTGGETVVVTVGGSTPPPPPAESSPAGRKPAGRIASPAANRLRRRKRRPNRLPAGRG